jgi:hypothetical protein
LRFGTGIVEVYDLEDQLALEIDQRLGKISDHRLYEELRGICLELIIRGETSNEKFHRSSSRP